MRLISTRPPYGEVSLRQAVLEDPSPDGGLYLPVSLPRFTRDEVEALEGLPFPRLAENLAQRIFPPALDAETVSRIVASAFDFPVPLVPLGERTWILELFHGPTGSFKDFGARFLARLLSVLRDPDEGPVLILVATSGDTGGAVADAVKGLEGVQAMVLFPKDWVSPVQLEQIVGPGRAEAPEGGGVIPVEVDGTFDDCQRMVKSVLANPGPDIPVMLTSANSVNIGRLLPQSFYYAQGWNSLPPEYRERPAVSVPSGNLGNLTAGVIARRMGIPLGRFIAASNANAAMRHFIDEGTLPQGPSLRTLSSAMDVSRPSNLERLVSIFEGSIPGLESWILPTRHPDGDVLDAMARVHEQHGYFLDPHTAVGYLGLEEYRQESPDDAGLILSTADPAKFPATVSRAVGQEPPIRSDWEPVPEGDTIDAPDPTVSLGPDPDELRELIRSR